MGWGTCRKNIRGCAEKPVPQIQGKIDAKMLPQIKEKFYKTVHLKEFVWY
jgi:hypothetical protein